MKEKKSSVRRSAKTPAAVKPSGGVTFEPNPFYERLLEMRVEKPSAFNNLSAATRFAVEAYVRAKQSAAGGPEVSKAAA